MVSRVQLLSLTNCADTIVGNGMIRGVSGGEKKRVTTGEIVVGPSKVLFMDEISTGARPHQSICLVACANDNLLVVTSFFMMFSVRKPYQYALLARHAFVVLGCGNAFNRMPSGWCAIARAPPNMSHRLRACRPRQRVDVHDRAVAAQPRARHGRDHRCRAAAARAAGAPPPPLCTCGHCVAAKRTARRRTRGRNTVHAKDSGRRRKFILSLPAGVRLVRRRAAARERPHPLPGAPRRRHGPLQDTWIRVHRPQGRGGLPSGAPPCACLPRCW
jgi:hypothetical protein